MFLKILLIPLRLKGKKDFEINERVNFLLKSFDISKKKKYLQETYLPEMLNLFHLSGQLLMIHKF